MGSIVYVTGHNGVKYAYWNESFRNKETGKVEHRRTAMGKHLDPETGELVPNRKRGDAAKRREEEAIEKAQVAREQAGFKWNVATTGDVRLLNHVVEYAKLQKPLEAAFPGTWDRILTCAYYLVSTGQALYRVDRWTRNRETPCVGSAVCSQRISELLVSITDAEIHEFFTKWGNRFSTDEPYALDITSVSSYGTANEFLRRGYNRDGEDLPQINMLLVVGQNSRMPLYYRILKGNIGDVRTLRKTLALMHLLDKKGLHVVMDRAFCNRNNLDDLYKYHMKFTMGVPFTMNLARRPVEENQDTIRDVRNMHRIGNDIVYGTTALEKWNGHRLYVHTFFDSLRAELERREFHEQLLMCLDELKSANLVKAHQKTYDEYFVVRETPKRGRRVSFNVEAVNAFDTKRAGWFVIASNTTKDTWKALEEYRGRDTVEKSFDDIKNDLDLHRLRIHSAEAMDGRVFIQFIALIIESSMRSFIESDSELAQMSLREVLDEMSSFRELSIEGHRKSLPSEATQLQQHIADCFGFTLPVCV